jgi:cellobiose phosphorylase
MASRFGYFDDERREYVITRPDTPLPWLNYLGQDDLFGLCTNTAGGYTFWRDARLRRLTRYRYNNAPLDTGGRYLYIHDNGDVWNPGWKPVKALLDSYQCHVGLGYVRITGSRGGLEVEQLMFIPPGEDVEIWKVTVRNMSDERKRPRLYSFVEFAFYEALVDMTNYQRTYSIGEVVVDGSAIHHVTEVRERRDHSTMFACTVPVTGFDTARDAFVGVHEGLHEPRVPMAGTAMNSIAHGWNPIGSHEVTFDLAPGEANEVSFLLVYVQHGTQKFTPTGQVDVSRGHAIVDRWSAPEVVDAAFERLRQSWANLLGGFQVTCPDEHLSRMVNTWNQYQCMATFNLSRSASLFETGIGRGMGFRDSNQDLLGFVHMIPHRARQRLLDLAATQLLDGTCFHQYQPLTKQGNADVGGDFYDDHLWLVLATCAYLKETGDTAILEAPCGYADGDYEDESDREPLLHHLETSLAYTMSHRGPHGLPLIGHADWNDCLNLNCFSTEPNESFQTAGDVAGSVAESVMIAGLFLVAANEMAELYEHLRRYSDVSRVRGWHDEMLAAVETHAWDGDWWLRAYDADGNPVGSVANDEGQIFIESQAWCALGCAGRDGRTRRALASVEDRLTTSNGIVLQQPAYTRYRLELGEITSYPPGVKENAGIFCHNNTWIHLAWCTIGDGERALAGYRSICPSTKEEQIDTYRCEPYVYAQTIAGPDSPTFGEAKNSWLTGTAAWTFVVASQGILGIQPDHDGLRINPCIASSWPGFRVSRRFRGATYDITVRNPDGVMSGVAWLVVDGRRTESNLVPVAAPGSTVRVEVTLGAKSAGH